MGRELPDYRKLVLDAMPGTAPELAKKTKLACKTIRRWLGILQRPGPDRCARIESWVRRSKGPSVPVHGRGSAPDEPKPSPYSNAERCARYLDANGKRTGCVDRLHKRDEYKAIPVVKVDYRQDPLLSWIPSRAAVLEVRP